MPSHFEFPIAFRALYERAVERYGSGQRGAATFFGADDLAFMAANGLTAQALFDYAEDHHNYGEPGFEQALLIESVRRDYFLNAQGGVASTTVLDDAKLPAKTDAVRGVEWLPRLLPKAKAKLRGELPASLMYCCGGDRRFFKAHNILPAEFLSLVWRHWDEEAAVVEWVLRRAKS